MGKTYRVYSKVWKTPRRCYEKERLDRELKLVGEYGQLPACPAQRPPACVLMSVLQAAFSSQR
jgi:hypothetical protein